MKRIIYSFVSVCLLLSSCSMDETPQASVDKDTVFRTEKGLETYSYSFYNMLPSVSDGFRQDAMCDYGAVTSFDNFIREGAYSAELSSGWSWSDLRNINYFIENCTNEAVDESVRPRGNPRRRGKLAHRRRERGAQERDNRRRNLHVAAVS